ncbi:MAG: hypothetical protein IT436_07690 [Phycisphaerales bacterium]|nr:hypothetical protein [Phycisphaerales bacterium]
MGTKDLAAADPLAGIAREAHAAWCRRMIEQGWSPGDRYDEKARTHDALVPFDRLPQPVRGWLIDIMRVEEVESTLADLIERPRGPDRVAGENRPSPQNDRDPPLGGSQVNPIAGAGVGSRLRPRRPVEMAFRWGMTGVRTAA